MLCVSRGFRRGRQPQQRPIGGIPHSRVFVVLHDLGQFGENVVVAIEGFQLAENGGSLFAYGRAGFGQVIPGLGGVV